MPVQIRAGIMRQHRVAIHLEINGQYLFAHHLLERLSASLQAVTLQAVTEYLMEKHAARRSRKDEGVS